MNPNKQNVNMSLKRNTGTPRDRNPVCWVRCSVMKLLQILKNIL